MKRILYIILTLLVSCQLNACNTDDDLNNSLSEQPENTDGENDEANGLKLSDLYVRISSNNKIASFRLYDTKAAQQFYDQLPLELTLSNFRDAQWMFYPPQKLDVTSQEAYHDGKKGELSYYAPWGDVFMLYKDFYAGDEMHRLGISESGINEIEEMNGAVRIEKINHNEDNTDKMKLKITVGNRVAIADLYDNPTTKSLIAQLPLEVTLSDYANTEKVFYPPQELVTQGVSTGLDPEIGDITCYAPWGNIAIFYKDYGYASGLILLGKITEEIDILQVSGSISAKIELLDQNTTGITVSKGNEAKILTNPFSDYIHVEGNISEATLYDLNGSVKATNKGNVLNTSMISSGIYILKAKDSDNKILTAKVIKK